MLRGCFIYASLNNRCRSLVGVLEELGGGMGIVLFDGGRIFPKKSSHHPVTFRKALRINPRSTFPTKHPFPPSARRPSQPDSRPETYPQNKTHTHETIQDYTHHNRTRQRRPQRLPRRNRTNTSTLLRRGGRARLPLPTRRLRRTQQAHSRQSPLRSLRGQTIPGAWARPRRPHQLGQYRPNPCRR